MSHQVDTAVMEIRVKALLSDRSSLEEIKKLKARERDLSRAFGETSAELEDLGRLLDAKLAAIARDIAEIKQATTLIEKSQEKMSLSLDKISKGFEELARQGGIISSPKTPEEFARKRPDFGPIYYELSSDYSEARLPGRGIEDKRREKEYLGKFLAAHKAGRFVRWFIDKALVAEYLADGERQLAELGATPAALMEKPVSPNRKGA